MCAFRDADKRGIRDSARIKSSRRGGIRRLSALVFVFSLLSGALAAQSNLEEYELVRSFVLPDSAVSFSLLDQQGEQWFRDGQPFSGIAFERFENGRLARLMQLRNGLQEGRSYLWYPDGAPQMSASYRAGRLNGRFLGWYRHGGVIYDMVINQSGYAGDYIEDDGSRSAEESGDADQEGDTQDSGRE